MRGQKWQNARLRKNFFELQAGSQDHIKNESDIYESDIKNESVGEVQKTMVFDHSPLRLLRHQK